MKYWNTLLDVSLPLLLYAPKSGTLLVSKGLLKEAERASARPRCWTAPVVTGAIASRCRTHVRSTALVEFDKGPIVPNGDGRSCVVKQESSDEVSMRFGDDAVGAP
jgi:hypothetical protein